MLRVIGKLLSQKPSLGLTYNTFKTTANVHLKQIIVEDNQNELVIQGKTVDSLRVPYMLKDCIGDDKCPACSTKLDIKHTDVLILSQFVRSDGCMLPRRITGLCKAQQKRMSTLVSMAHKAGLMPDLAPENSKKNPKLRTKWKKFNTYFDEDTIKVK